MIVRGFRNEYFFLSNFYDAPFVYEGIQYANNEAAFQAQKCLERRIEFCHLSPADAKRLGRAVTLRSDWQRVKDDIMYDICYAKFTQHTALQEKLIALNNAMLLEENNWGDMYWGVVHGKGKNRLGEILMTIAEELTYFTVIVTGGNDFTDYKTLRDKCDYMLSNVNKPIVIAVNGYNGANALSIRYAKERGYNIKQHTLNCTDFYASQYITRYADAVIAFYNGACYDTHAIIEAAYRKAMPVRVVSY